VAQQLQMIRPHQYIQQGFDPGKREGRESRQLAPTPFGHIAKLFRGADFDAHRDNSCQMTTGL
jgi:hypothetical protein